MVLDFIRGYIREHGYSPTLREIAVALGIKTPRGVKAHLISLEKKGYITLEPGKARSISIREKSGLPLIGLSAAGSPINVEENYIESYVIDEKLTGRGKHFIVRVTGDSMILRGIDNGDLVVIKEGDNDVKIGDVVLVKINGEVTLKTLMKKSEQELVLKPENPEYPIIRATSSDEVEIIGKAVLVLKKI